ncbi:MAG: ATP-binding protein [Lachnospiraceae bacterium]|nr:ATP-binding protein [Lachnospiraceae bacterium]
MDAEYIGVKELAEKWGITTRRINQLCAENYFPGAYKKGKLWMVPSDAEKPAVLREKKAKAGRSRAKTTKLLPCPVGITSYKEVSRECYYVDKTLLIKDIIDDHNKVYLFTRPRRFGKTLTLDMVRTFFERTEEDTSVYFSDKEIWSAGKEYRSYQGKYPVIFISFKDAHQKSWEDMYQNLYFSIKEAFLAHIELLGGDRLNEFDKKFYQRIVESSAGTTEVQFALGKLCSMLARHYGQKVIVILDEYDTPIQQGYLNGCYGEVIDFMRNLFSAGLKDNEDLEFGIMTGILRIAKESLFSGLNNLVVNTIMDDKYAQYFGFTQKEVSEMAAYYGREEKLSEIRSWYDGYLFGSEEIYNPWSVINYFNNNCKPKAFWSRTSGNEMIGQLIRDANSETYESLSALMQGREVQAIIDTDIIYPELNGEPDTIYSFLLVAGYLRVTETVSTFNDNPICSLAIPNQEIKSVFQKEILNLYSAVFTGSLLRDFEVSIRTGNSTLLTETLQKYLLQSASIYDTAYESFYHGTVFGMLAVMSDSYYITSNRESGEGRFDVQLEPRDKSRTGFILEFKTKKDLDDAGLKALAAEGLKQIRDRRYYTDMEYHGVSDIVFFGIGFSGKKVAVAVEKK